MRSYLSVLVSTALLFVAVPLKAQQAAPDFKTPTTRRVIYSETVPAYVPTSPTAVWGADIWLEEITLTNISGSSVTCTVQDNQSSPMAIVSVSISAGQNYLMEYQARYAPGGVTWSCGTGSAVVGYMRGKR